MLISFMWLLMVEHSWLNVDNFSCLLIIVNFAVRAIYLGSMKGLTI